MEYIRFAPDKDSDPDIEAAGWCAARVHELLIMVSGQKDLGGCIPPQYQDPAWLARRWNLGREDLPGIEPADFIANGVYRLLKFGLLVVEGECWLIRSWEKFYGKKPTSTGRVQKHRRVKRGETPETDETLASVSETPPPSETHETTHHSTSPTPLHSTPPTKEAAAGAVEAVNANDTLQDAVESLWTLKRGRKPSRGWFTEAALRPAFDAAGGNAREVLRVLSAALDCGYPKLVRLADLARYWDTYAATKGPEPGRKAGPHARATEADRVQPGYEPKLDEHGNVDLGAA